MTERQGGSDVRVNTTTARPLGGDEYALDGEKWFCSAPMSDAFLVLAQAPGGLSCFLLPRVLPDGTRNGFRLQRLKDKLGDRANASSEVALEGAWARLVGEEGRGVRTILEMVVHTRLDCVLGTAAGMREGVEQATHHAAHRVAFGKLLADQPLMRGVLADLCVESEAATVTAMRLARAYDRRAAGDEREAAFARIATAVAKYWICKRGPAHAAEALECVGGSGYVEESVLPRVYRQAPLLSIWEGPATSSASTSCARCSGRRRPSRCCSTRSGSRASRARPRSPSGRSPSPTSSSARIAVERLALALQASLLVRHAPPAVADAFARARLAGEAASRLRDAAFGRRRGRDRRAPPASRSSPTNLDPRCGV